MTRFARPLAPLALAFAFLVPAHAADPAAPAAAAPAANLPKLEEILAKANKARGGLEKVKALKTIRMSGKTTVGPGMEAPMAIEMKRPNRMRTDFTFQGMTGTQAFDGAKGWSVMPFMGKTDPEPMSDDEVKKLLEEADMDGALVEPESKGIKVELAGKEQFEGTEAYKLKVTRKGGSESYVFLDAEAMLEIGMSGSQSANGMTFEYTVTVGDYKPVNGIMFPHSMETTVKGMPGTRKVTFEKIEVDVDIDDARFAMPAKKAAAPADTAAAAATGDKPAEKAPEAPKDGKK